MADGTLGVERTPVQDFLARQIGWKPVLRRPLHNVLRPSLPQGIWWAEVNSLEFVGAKAVPDMASLTPFARSLVDLREREPADAVARHLAAFDADPAWHHMRTKVETMLSSSMRKPVAAWCADAFREGMRTEYALQRIRGKVSDRGAGVFLLACHFGNYPFALDARGTLYLCCA